MFISFVLKQKKRTKEKFKAKNHAPLKAYAPSAILPSQRTFKFNFSLR